MCRPFNKKRSVYYARRQERHSADEFRARVGEYVAPLVDVNSAASLMSIKGASCPDPYPFLPADATRRRLNQVDDCRRSCCWTIRRGRRGRTASTSSWQHNKSLFSLKLYWEMHKGNNNDDESTHSNRPSCRQWSEGPGPTLSSVGCHSLTGAGNKWALSQLGS